MLNTGTITAREALLGSLLMHACFIIYVLLFPHTFLSGGSLRTPARDPNRPIPLEFLPSDPVRPDPDSASLSDAGDRKGSDPRPESAPPAENSDPYAEGNTRNRFLAPAEQERMPPAPVPGGWLTAPPAPPPVDAEGSQTARESFADDEVSDDPTTPADDRTRFILPKPEGGPPGNGSRGGAGRRLREALDRMSADLSVSGGSPLRFDNPVGGLNTPSGGLSFDTPGFNWGPYARKIYWIIWSNWVRGWPPAARAGLAGSVTVRFRIHRDGSISGIQVLDPSGAPGYDMCATLALEASSPLPPLPGDYTGESEGVTARFLYNMDRPGR